MARDPIVTRFARLGGGVTTFARACPVSLSRNPLSPGIEATPKTDLSLSRSLVHRQTWRLTGCSRCHLNVEIRTSFIDGADDKIMHEAGVKNIPDRSAFGKFLPRLSRRGRQFLRKPRGLEDFFTDRVRYYIYRLPSASFNLSFHKFSLYE